MRVPRYATVRYKTTQAFGLMIPFLLAEPSRYLKIRPRWQSVSKGAANMTVRYNHVREHAVGEDCEFSFELLDLPADVTILESRLSIRTSLKSTAYVAQSVITGEDDIEGKIFADGSEGNARLLHVIPRSVSKLLTPEKDYFYDVQVYRSDLKSKQPFWGTVVFAPQVTTEVPQDA